MLLLEKLPYAHSIQYGCVLKKRCLPETFDKSKRRFKPLVSGSSLPDARQTVFTQVSELETCSEGVRGRQVLQSTYQTNWFLLGFEPTGQWVPLKPTGSLFASVARQPGLRRVCVGEPEVPSEPDALARAVGPKGCCGSVFKTALRRCS